MITFGLPCAILVQPAMLSPTRAAGRPLIKTVVEPRLTLAVCGGHFFPGLRWVVVLSPSLQAGRPLINTFGLPVAMECPLQCGTLRSDNLAAAGTFPLHQLLQQMVPSPYFFVLGVGMRARGYLGYEFYHMIKNCWYVFITIKNIQLTTIFDHEPMRHSSQL